MNKDSKEGKSSYKQANKEQKNSTKSTKKTSKSGGKQEKKTNKSAGDKSEKQTDKGTKKSTKSTQKDSKTASVYGPKTDADKNPFIIFFNALITCVLLLMIFTIAYFLLRSIFKYLRKTRTVYLKNDKREKAEAAAQMHHNVELKESLNSYAERAAIDQTYRGAMPQATNSNYIYSDPFLN